MPFITREDGERFVIPSYRDVLTCKQQSQLKKEILLLSQSYGEYITLQKKGPMQYEVAFSSDTGHLLGESIWAHFKRPNDLIYCEAIPNTSEAILVIVKAGSVYLDGSFPLDTIPEELVIFLTQQNHFEIYVHGDVPIHAAEEAGKFNFEPSQVKSFTVLDKPVFPTLPLLNAYQLQLVDPILKKYGIGIFPIRQVLTSLAALTLLWMAYVFFSAPQQDIAPAQGPINQYATYQSLLMSKNPTEQIVSAMAVLIQLNTVAGWNVKKLDFANDRLNMQMLSQGGRSIDLLNYAEANQFQVNMTRMGIFLSQGVNLPNRAKPNQIYSLREVVATVIDRLALVYPGNNLQISDFYKKGSFMTTQLTIRLNGMVPATINLIGEQFKDLPVNLEGISVTQDTSGNQFSGTLTLQALGN